LRPLFSGGYRPSGLARAEIPAPYLRLYVAAGRRYGIDPWILAASARSKPPTAGLGVHSGVNAFGCCAGPMQFSVVGSPSTWDRYGVDGNDEGRISVYDPADAIPAAARYLAASGAPDDYHAALLAYNHAEWYVTEVLAKGTEYRGSAEVVGDTPELDSGVLSDVLHNPHPHADPTIRPALRRDRPTPHRHARVDRPPPLRRHHRTEVRPLPLHHRRQRLQPRRRPRYGHRHRGRRDLPRDPHRQLRRPPVRELAAVHGPLRATELIYCWDPDGPADPRGFARADHCDHIHWGMD
jgi:hypothetical protein